MTTFLFLFDSDAIPRSDIGADSTVLHGPERASEHLAVLDGLLAGSQTIWGSDPIA